MKILLLVSILALCQLSFATTYIVDINGGGQYTSINAAIGVATTNDTVKVWPGTYEEYVTLNKNITLMGSGYENTIIRGNFNPVVTVSSGRLQWFQVTSLNGVGINISGGEVKNCVIRDCAVYGILCPSGTTSVVSNCVIVNNGNWGVITGGGTLSVVNCIARTTVHNTNGDFARSTGTLNLSYSDGYHSGTSGNQGCIDQDPLFASSINFHISEGSPCWNTGNTSLNDPDGSVSDMGYFGGPDCPIYPVVTEIIIIPAGNTINLQAKARANY